MIVQGIKFQQNVSRNQGIRRAQNAQKNQTTAFKGDFIEKNLMEKAWAKLMQAGGQIQVDKLEITAQEQPTKGWWIFKLPPKRVFNVNVNTPSDQHFKQITMTYYSLKLKSGEHMMGCDCKTEGVRKNGKPCRYPEYIPREEAGDNLTKILERVVKD